MSEIEKFPAPWSLQGYGYIFMFKAEPEWLLEHGFIDAGMLEHYVPSVGSAMLVNYESSTAGPYGELLFIPGKFKFPSGERYSISKIYVSSMQSVVNGQDNWGIPKELADFTFEKQAGVGSTRQEHIRITLPEGGEGIADMTLSHKPWGVPVTTALLPEKFRTVAQHWQDQLFYTAPSARSKLKFAKLEQAEFNQSLFPDLNGVNILAVFKAEAMKMQFPLPQMGAN